MTTKALSTLFLGAALALVATTAFADDSDPALFQDGSNCQPGTYWCSSTGTGLDTATGDTTLEFVLLNSGAVGATKGVALYSANDTGWVAVTSTGTSSGQIDDLLHFTTNATDTNDVVFVYCGDAHCSADDNALPSPSSYTLCATCYIQDNPLVGNPPKPSNGSATWDPTQEGLPGFALGLDPTKSPSTFDASYTIIDVSTPEPSAILLLGAMFLVLIPVVRKKFFVS